MKWRYILKEIEIKTGERNVESYYRLQYEVLRVLMMEKQTK